MKSVNFSNIFTRFSKKLPVLVHKQNNKTKNVTLNFNQIRTISITITNLQHKHKTQPNLNIFDKQAKILQRERATSSKDADFHSYLKDEIGYRLADRIFDIKRTFPKVLDLGCGRGHVSKHVVSDNVKELVMCDNTELLISTATCEDKEVQTRKVVADEENLLSVFEPDSFDMVISNLTLHWVNDLPKCFSQVMSLLRKDGVFLGSLFGSDTLYELRSSLQLAESERRGGISPHISPFARPRDVGSLLTQAGFVMQTIDTDEEVLKYPSMFELMEELKGMGENNAAWNRCLHLSRDTLLAAAAIYEYLYATTGQEKLNKNDDRSESDDEEDELIKNFKGIKASFQIIYFIGWKPDPSQPQPLPRGSAEMSLKDLYKLNDVIVKEGKNIKLDDDK